MSYVQKHAIAWHVLDTLHQLLAPIEGWAPIYNCIELRKFDVCSLSTMLFSHEKVIDTRLVE
jgi:hypothetical protein